MQPKPKPIKLRKATFKQKRFAQEYVRNNGNGTKAALEVYDTKDPATGNAIAVENLQKPLVKREIDKCLEKSGLNDSYISDKLKDSIEFGMGKKASQDTSLRGLDMLIRLRGLYPEKRTRVENYSLSLKKNLLSKNVIEIEEEVKKGFKQITQLARDLGIDLQQLQQETSVTSPATICLTEG